MIHISTRSRPTTPVSDDLFAYPTPPNEQTYSWSPNGAISPTIEQHAARIDIAEPGWVWGDNQVSYDSVMRTEPKIRVRGGPWPIRPFMIGDFKDGPRKQWIISTEKMAREMGHLHIAKLEGDEADTLFACKIFSLFSRHASDKALLYDDRSPLGPMKERYIPAINEDDAASGLDALFELRSPFAPRAIYKVDDFILVISPLAHMTVAEAMSGRLDSIAVDEATRARLFGDMAQLMAPQLLKQLEVAHDKGISHQAWDLDKIFITIDKEKGLNFWLHDFERGNKFRVNASRRLRTGNRCGKLLQQPEEVLKLNPTQREGLPAIMPNGRRSNLFVTDAPFRADKADMFAFGVTLLRVAAQNSVAFAYLHNYYSEDGSAFRAAPDMVRYMNSFKYELEMRLALSQTWHSLFDIYTNFFTKPARPLVPHIFPKLEDYKENAKAFDPLCLHDSVAFVATINPFLFHKLILPTMSPYLEGKTTRWPAGALLEHVQAMPDQPGFRLNLEEERHQDLGAAIFGCNHWRTAPTSHLPHISKLRAIARDAQFLQGGVSESQERVLAANDRFRPFPRQRRTAAAQSSTPVGSPTK